MAEDSNLDKLAFERSIEKVPWSVLQTQAEKDIYILVAADVDIAEAAFEVISDNAGKVRGWISEEKLTKPSSEQLSAWSRFPDKIFRALIAHPYVLIQESFDH